MKASSRSIVGVVALEAVAILGLLGLIWANEYLDLPHLLFDEPVTVPRLSELVLEGAVVLAFGAGMIATSVVMVRRVAYLESLLTLCASCQRISVGGEWISLEQLVANRDHLATTHGICGDCYEEQTSGLAVSARAS